ncbi:MAG TPA: glycosyltransferase family 2 protein [Verrucomicrobiae bacterium]|nr:glycosyltransferase family 2 protein [Verrucomicrobiae bacterium]
MKPRFSVVVPVYNRETLVKATIDSVLSQTFTGYELIVVDDGSTDRTPEVLRSYGSKIRVVRQENQGPEVARNTGASVANGEYIAILDSDDLLLPRALAAYECAIEKFQAPAVLVGAVVQFHSGEPLPLDKDGSKEIEVFLYRDYLSKEVAVSLNGSNVVIRKDVLEQAGGMRTSTPTTFYVDICDLMLRVGAYGPCVVIHRPPIVAYYLHEANSIRNVVGMVKGIYPLVEAEKSGRYPGGRARRFDRYACIGGMSWCWFRHALKDGHRRLALKLLIDTSPMIGSGLWKKVTTRLRKTQTAVHLTVE